ncbi:hypothetical protein ACIU1J_27440 [Azospirillum doebereinerae]|uniref:hypothetical protein n=1 Tax=Azospirillum doebereinerae TaxID=92933 RepID=UPI001EE4ED1D|nr:hypothetical protein [Azospirillum doebereinerae]MCG5241354.1 hypothetical protein [Azospirillum doebereinerae]
MKSVKTKATDLPKQALVPSNDDALPPDSLADDMLIGAAAIAAFTGLPARKVYHLAEQEAIPVFRMGATLCARKSTWLAWIAAQENVVIKK